MKHKFLFVVVQTIHLVPLLRETLWMARRGESDRDSKIILVLQ